MAIQTERKYLTHLGQQILTSLLDLRRTAICPECQQNHLTVKISGNTVHIICETPVGIDPSDSGTLYCCFNQTVQPTNLSLPPFNLTFEEQKKSARPLKQRTARRSTAAKKPRRVKPI